MKNGPTLKDFAKAFGIVAVVVLIFGAGFLLGKEFGYIDGASSVYSSPKNTMVEVLTDMPESQAVAAYLLRQDEKVQFSVNEAQTATWAVAINFRSNQYFEVDGQPATPVEGGYILTTIIDATKPEMTNYITKADGLISFFYTSGGGERVRMWIHTNP